MVTSIVIKLHNKVFPSQSNEVGGSYHVEKEGLSRAIQYVHDKGLTIQVLVTDRHRQIAKWMREIHPEIKHYFDVWQQRVNNIISFIPVCHFSNEAVILTCRCP